MAPQDEFYIAWDGREYAGPPPSGWFLAADNRWWPPRELIDGEETAEPELPEALPEQRRPDSPLPPNPAATERPMESTAPPEGWAPTPSGGAPDEPQPTRQSPPGTTGRRNRRKGKKNKFPIGQVLFFIFILSRCTGVFSDSSDQTDQTDFVVVPTGESTTPDSCSPTFLSGSITNDDLIPQTFVVTTERVDGGTDYQSDELLIGSGETGNWVINLSGEDRSSGFCPPVAVLVFGP